MVCGFGDAASYETLAGKLAGVRIDKSARFTDWSHRPLTERQIKRGSHRSVHDLEDAIRELIKVHNQQPKPFRWTKSADQILASIARFATSTLAAHAPDVYVRNQ